MSETIHRSPNETFAGYTQLTVEVCCNCGIMFAMPEEPKRMALQDHSRNFYCPNGHPQHFLGKTDEEKLREEVQRQKDEIQWQRNRADRLAAERDQVKASLRTQKGVATKLKKRIAAGVCPCCHHTFSDLANHMAGEHPDYPAAGDE